jgi:hypothetical protein
MKPLHKETAEICATRPSDRQSVANVATVAGGDAGNHPWSADLLAWASGRRPPFAQPVIWDALINEALTISRAWGDRAIAAGWSSLDLFGCYRRPQYRRLDCNGLVAGIVGLVTPVRLTDITPGHADLTDHHGNVMRHYRRAKPEAVHLWEAYVMRTGP